MAFPQHRGRRLRLSAGVRRLVRETDVSPRNLVLPLFAVPGKSRREEIASMPGVGRLSPDLILREGERALASGVPALILFGVPDERHDDARGAWDDAGPVAESVRLLKRELPELIVITDVCLCEYSRNGHCGVVRDGGVDNDSTIPLLARSALCHARAGADFVAPSDMMDGRVGHIRSVLDREGFSGTGIISYAAKYASAFYGPFREAAGSVPAFGDRRSHQMDPANVREALCEVREDIAEGADMVMVKPALACLDVVAGVRAAVDVPVVCYNVSGEYAMIKAAAANGWINERAAVLEALTAMRRAGAGIIMTYHALDAAEWLG